jgi:hypothetical protein
MRPFLDREPIPKFRIGWSREEPLAHVAAASLPMQSHIWRGENKMSLPSLMHSLTLKTLESAMAQQEKQSPWFRITENPEQRSFQMALLSYEVGSSIWAFAVPNNNNNPKKPPKISFTMKSLLLFILFLYPPNGR